MNIPVYRAKKIDSDEYIEGFLVPLNIGHHRISSRYMIVPSLNVMESYTNRTDFENKYKIDLSTLAIHFQDMLCSEGNKIFASLSENGKGGDLVTGRCRDINGDNIDVGLHEPLEFKGLVRFYKETEMSIVIETQDEMHPGTATWINPIFLKRGRTLRWSDCRHNINVIGIQDFEKNSNIYSTNILSDGL